MNGGSLCGDCHTGAVKDSNGGTAHVDGNIDVADGYPANVTKHAAGTYTGTCNGLTLTYDSGDSTGLGIAPGRVFPPGSPSSIVIVSKNNGGTEKWTTGNKTLTAQTTSAVTPNSITTVLSVS